jgi:formylglycine-generating enzyme required for sulfatase activity
MTRPRQPVASFALVVICLVLALAGNPAAQSKRKFQDTDDRFMNSVDVILRRVPAGRFRMGETAPTDPKAFKQAPLGTAEGDFDEHPVHDVTITSDFFMSETEITVEQFKKFRDEMQGDGRDRPSVTGISWDEATAFCAWLSKKEKKPYRLPTEAEWEYAARAGSTGNFPGGNEPPADDAPNAFGLTGMHGGALEWVHDWYGLYPYEPQSDPVGPATGWGRVVRGGGIQGPRNKDINGEAPFYRRSANRASAPAAYRGQHRIGFRIVMAPLPKTAPLPVETPFATQAVKQTGVPLTSGPDPKVPYLVRRPVLPTPPENMFPDAIRASGVEPGIFGHNHSAGLTVAPNGDLFYIAFSADTPHTEYLPDTTFIAARRRFGSQEWDPPSLFMDFADVNDQSALLMTDGKEMWFFGGGVGLPGVPFRITKSSDSGATWSPIELPLLRPPVGGWSPQPIEHAFRTKDGALNVAIDGVGGESRLMATRDNGVTWGDAGGGTAGRHTVFVTLKDGSILGIGGKNTDIDRFMPQALSHDGGKTWTVSKTPFPALGSNQRPALVKLANGHLFFASDWQERDNKPQPAGITQRGVFVAISDDDGKTWKIKTLPGSLPHEGAVFRDRPEPMWTRFGHNDGTLGYAVATQGPDGLIHLLSSMTHPSMEYELNEAWVLSDTTDDTVLKPAAGGKTVSGGDRWSASDGGKPRSSWSGVVSKTRGFTLDGPERWLRPDGTPQYEVTWRDGKKVGVERLFDQAGRKLWERDHREDGVTVWTQYWSNGQVRSKSEWKDGKAEGTATHWTPEGQEAGHYEFRHGDVVR